MSKEGDMNADHGLELVAIGDVAEPFSEKSIVNALDRLDLHYLRGSHGAFLVRFADESGPTMDVYLADEEHFYVIRALSSRRPVLRDVHDVTLEIINSWNRDTRVVKAYVDGAGGFDAAERVVLEATHVMFAPVGTEQMAALTGATIGAAQEFFALLHDERDGAA